MRLVQRETPFSSTHPLSTTNTVGARALAESSNAWPRIQKYPLVSDCLKFLPSELNYSRTPAFDRGNEKPCLAVTTLHSDRPDITRAVACNELALSSIAS